MGLFNLADVVTGSGIPGGSRAVLLVIARRTGGYPDATAAAAIPGVYANHLFEAVSLPIRGELGGYGDFEPDPNQLAVDLVLKRTGHAKWSEFEQINLGVHGKTAARAGLGEGPLGVAMMTEITFDRALKLGRVDDAEVETVMTALWDAAQKKDLDGPTHGVLMLSRDAAYKLTDGGVVDSPLLSVLSSLDGPASVADRLRDDLQFMVFDALIAAEKAGALSVKAPTIREVLHGLKGYRAVMLQLYLRNRYLVPSPTAGQVPTPEREVDAALDDVEDSLESLLVRLDDLDSDDLEDECEKLLDRMSMISTTARERLARLRAERDAEFTPPNLGSH